VALGLVRILSQLVLAPFFPMTVEGFDQVPAKGPFVLLPKHQRWQDIPLLGLSCPRPLYYLAKAELFKNPLGHWGCTLLGGLPLDRSRPLASRRSFVLARAVLKQGHPLVVFPEGTYFPGRLGPGQQGAIRWLLGGEAPFIPVGIAYRQNGRRCPVTIRYGLPANPLPEESASAFVNRLMEAIGRLSGLDRPT